MRRNPISIGNNTLYTKDEVDALFARHMGGSAKTSSGRKTRKAPRTPAAEPRVVQTPGAPVSYRQGLTIGSALGGLDNYCPAAIRPRAGVKFSNADALTAMGLNRGQASEIISALKGEKDKEDRKQIVLYFFEQFGVSCPL